MSHLWQHPYVNVFKHFNLSSWKKSTKEGEVASSMDKQLKGTVYKITGSIPAGNYIQLPKTSSQSLGLSGRYFYLLFKPIPSKYFVVHIDLVTPDNLVVRLSFSNLFKEFKATSTWLQFPFLCNTDRGCAFGYASAGNKEKAGPAPISSRWTVLCLDFHYILSMYLNRKFSYMKSVKLCANMLVRNIFTSDFLYEPGLTVEEVKKAGGISNGMSPMPREMAFPLMKTDNWSDHYDLIRFPAELSSNPTQPMPYPPCKGNPDENPRHVVPRLVDVSRCTTEKVSLIHSQTSLPKLPGKKITVTKELPSVNVHDLSISRDDNGEVHIYANPSDQVVVHRPDHGPGKVQKSATKRIVEDFSTKKECKTLLPDPILQLKRIIGYGGASHKYCLWSSDGKVVVYPCHAVVVAMNVNSGHQRFFIGHTDKVSCVSLTINDALLATGQTGSMSVVRVWNFRTGECLAMCKTHVHSLHALCFSLSGNVLCGVGKDGHSKNMIVLWNTSKVSKTREITVISKAHTDVDIQCMKIAPFDETRLVSCGRDNVRLWRVKDGCLRSGPVHLAEYHNMEFTDVCFEAGYNARKDPADRLVYACSRTGYIVEIDYQKLSIRHVRRLLPNAGKSKQEKQSFNSGGGISINGMKINESFCVTGSDDGYLRLWPLDFSRVFLEAVHEGPVTAVDISADGTKVLAGTSSGNLGVLDVCSRDYTTIMRSHTKKITSLSVDPYRKHIVTVAEDHTIRVWDSDSLQQLYDFSAPKECPCVVCYHPLGQIFSCGFEGGTVKVFNVSTTSMLAEHRQHWGKVIGLAYSPNGDYMYSVGSLGSIALYDCSDNSYELIRLLGNTVARGEKFGPDAVAVSPRGEYIAFIGPTEYTISVASGRSLDEVMRIDITHMNVVDNSRTEVDSALKVVYTPESLNQLLVTTASNKLLKFNAKTGRLLAEVEHIHRTPCTSLDTTADGCYLATAGDRVVKIWDYNMNLDINFQVFIGHSEAINQVQFMPDGQSFLSAGEALYLWDFLADKQPTPYLPEGRNYQERDWFHSKDNTDIVTNSPVRRVFDSFTDLPRQTPPKPAKYDSPVRIDDLSSIHRASDTDEVNSEGSVKEAVIVGPRIPPQKAPSSDEDEAVVIISKSFQGESPHVRQVKSSNISSESNTQKQKSVHVEKPSVHKHFIQREKSHSLAQRRYTAPPNQAGLKLKSVIGYNGNGRGNMVWQPDSGLFIYTSGCVVIVEDLNTSSQQFLQGHVEEISTIALQSDCQVLASVSGTFEQSACQLCVWDLPQLVCKRSLTPPHCEVVSLAYSRDDRFLLSVGDYRDCSVVVWSTYDYTVLTQSTAAKPIHEVRWDPYTANEFASVGAGGNLLFWLLDETSPNVSLNVHEARVPSDLLRSHVTASPFVTDFTSLEYAGGSVLYVATSSGRVSAWDTRSNTCFIHWEADFSDIDFLVCRHGRLLTASSGRNLRLWSVQDIEGLKSHGESLHNGGLTMEDEMSLDGAVASIAFDDILEMGIVGTSSGTLWYINWSERTSIRLVSGHSKQVNGVGMSVACPNHFVTCADDGSLRVWSVADREQVLQFQVTDQKCSCLTVSPESRDRPGRSGNQAGRPQMPYVAGGYTDGTVRMFDIDKVEMVLKLHPHAVSVTAISFSDHGRMILSGGSDGLIAVSSPTTGLTVRVITDHKGAHITNFDVTASQEQEFGVSAPVLWLACSIDRRVSVWSADWSKDFCELVDWLTFPAPAYAPEGSVKLKSGQDLQNTLPPSLAKFSTDEPDIIVYIGYGMQRQVSFYSMAQRKVVRTAALTHWGTCLDICPTGSLMALGSKERLVKLMDYYEGSFQDFTGMNDSMQVVKFSPDGRLLFTAAHSEIFVWEVLV
ncbi:WD repeat-containing protein 90-like isoform X2 [Liolophura sinensis]|uniref:WD repeat-containing protein 90-like isoform X2 n=1 Tax=Liolophura sinensis TaxID=3198878 RepID=UPI0031598FBA